MEKRNFSSQEINAICHQYKVGVSGRTVAENFHCSNGTIYRLLKNHGIKSRSRSQNAKLRWGKSYKTTTFWNRRYLLPEQRFLNNIKIATSGCWEWQGKINNWGYGEFAVEYKHNRRFYTAHRYSYLLYNGPIQPPNFVVDHICRNRHCVNPKHLRVISRGENVLAGLGPPAQNARKTHCLRSHPLSGNNIYIDSNGARVCIACKQSKQKRYKSSRN